MARLGGGNLGSVDDDTYDIESVGSLEIHSASDEEDLAPDVRELLRRGKEEASLRSGHLRGESSVHSIDMDEGSSATVIGTSAGPPSSADSAIPALIPPTTSTEISASGTSGGGYSATTTTTVSGATSGRRSSRSGPSLYRLDSFEESSERVFTLISRVVYLIQVSTYSLLEGPIAALKWRNDFSRMRSEFVSESDMECSPQERADRFCYEDLEKWLPRQTLDGQDWRRGYDTGVRPRVYSKKFLFVPEFGVIVQSIEFDSSLVALQDGVDRQVAPDDGDLMGFGGMGGLMDLKGPLPGGPMDGMLQLYPTEPSSHSGTQDFGHDSAIRGGADHFDEDPTSIGRFSFALAIPVEFYDQFLAAAPAIEHWCVIVALHCRYLFAQTRANRLAAQSAGGSMFDYETGEECDAYECAPLVDALVSRSIRKFDVFFECGLRLPIHLSETHFADANSLMKKSNKFNIAKESPGDSRSNATLHDTSVDPPTKDPSSIAHSTEEHTSAATSSSLSSAVVVPLKGLSSRYNADFEYDLCQIISCHLQTGGRTVIVGDNQDEVDTYIRSLALFCTEDQCRLSRMSVLVDDPSDLLCHYVPELFVQGLVLNPRQICSLFRNQIKSDMGSSLTKRGGQTVLPSNLSQFPLSHSEYSDISAAQLATPPALRQVHSTSKIPESHRDRPLSARASSLKPGKKKTVIRKTTFAPGMGSPQASAASSSTAVTSKEGENGGFFGYPTKVGSDGKKLTKRQRQKQLLSDALDWYFSRSKAILLLHNELYMAPSPSTLVLVTTKTVRLKSAASSSSSSAHSMNEEGRESGHHRKHQHRRHKRRGGEGSGSSAVKGSKSRRRHHHRRSKTDGRDGPRNSRDHKREVAPTDHGGEGLDLSSPPPPIATETLSLDRGKSVSNGTQDSSMRVSLTGAASTIADSGTLTGTVGLSGDSDRFPDALPPAPPLLPSAVAAAAAVALPPTGSTSPVSPALSTRSSSSRKRKKKGGRRSHHHSHHKSASLTSGGSVGEIDPPARIARVTSRFEVKRTVLPHEFAREKQITLFTKLVSYKHLAQSVGDRDEGEQSPSSSEIAESPQSNGIVSTVPVAEEEDRDADIIKEEGSMQTTAVVNPISMEGIIGSCIGKVAESEEILPVHSLVSEEHRMQRFQSMNDVSFLDRSEKVSISDIPPSLSISHGGLLTQPTPPSLSHFSGRMRSRSTDDTSELETGSRVSVKLSMGSSTTPVPSGLGTIIDQYHNHGASASGSSLVEIKQRKKTSMKQHHRESVDDSIMFLESTSKRMKKMETVHISQQKQKQRIPIVTIRPPSVKRLAPKIPWFLPFSSSSSKVPLTNNNNGVESTSSAMISSAARTSGLILSTPESVKTDEDAYVSSSFHTSGITGSPNQVSTFKLTTTKKKTKKKTSKTVDEDLLALSEQRLLSEIMNSLDTRFRSEIKSAPMIQTLIQMTLRKIPGEFRIPFLQCQFRIILMRCNEVIIFLEHCYAEVLRFYDRTSHVMNMNKEMTGVSSAASAAAASESAGIAGSDHPSVRRGGGSRRMAGGGGSAAGVMSSTSVVMPDEVHQKDFRKSVKLKLRQSLRIESSEDLKLLLSFAQVFRPNLYFLLFSNPVFNITPNIEEVLQFFFA